MNIAIVTGSRAERGLMEGLADKLGADVIDLSYLIKSFPVATPCFQQGAIIHRIEYKIKEKCPDFAILPGDRYEMVAAGIALHMLKVPCVHIFGGYVTEGSQDDAWRHCLTKLSQLHFVETEECRQRVIQLGEHPDTVHNVGMIGCDFSDIKADSTYDYIVIYHPETLGETDVEPLKKVMRGKNYLWIHPNSDPGREVAETGYKLENGFSILQHLPRKAFLPFLKGAKAIIGNSSAGIREAPMLGTWTINIGERQKGRGGGATILPTENNIDCIRECIRIVEETTPWRLSENHDGTDEIARILNEWKPTIRKRFYDI